MLRLLEHSFESPAANLAYDEVLLDAAEALGHGGEVLRFWESPAPFVVLGVGQRLTAEVYEEACRADGVPVLRRCTAGGCVLQGPGSLNFSLVFSFADRPEVRGLHESYAYILNRIAAAFNARGVAAEYRGICDLALGQAKISGNAQRRRRRAMLHHGALLYAPDYPGMARYLQEPEDRPDYRGERTHEDFVGAIPLSPAVLRQAVCEAFGVDVKADTPTATELAQVDHLAATKYLSEAWIRRR